jgi:hypothetical protein
MHLTVTNQYSHPLCFCCEGSERIQVMRGWYLHSYRRRSVFYCSLLTVLWFQDAEIVIGLSLKLSFLSKGYLHCVRPGQSLCPTVGSTIRALDENKLECSIYPS